MTGSKVNPIMPKFPRFKARPMLHERPYFVPGHTSHSKDGKREHVRGHWVGGHNVEDRGAPGRTPKSNRWFRPKGNLHGWEANQRASTRHGHLRKSVKADGYATTVRRLNALRNVSTSRHVDAVAKADMGWLHRTFRSR